jgi:diguanylate cyclase (GGDEF)-like protein
MTPITALSNLSIRSKITLAVVLVAAWAAAAGNLTYRSMARLELASSWTDHTYEVLVRLGILQQQLLDLESAQRGFLLTGDAGYFRPDTRSGRLINRSFSELREMTSDNPVQRTNLARVGDLMHARLNVLDQTLTTYERHGQNAAIAALKTNDGKFLMDRLTNALARVDGEERRLLTLRRAEEQASRAENNRIIVIAAVGTSVLLLFMVLLIRDDLEARTRLREALDVLAMQDALTGLANQVSFENSLKMAVARATRNHRKLAVLNFDLDGFDDVNTRFGRHAGDEMLRIIARRLSESLRTSDVVARIDGDEFMVLLDEIAGHDEAGIAAGKVIRAISRAVDLGKGNEGRTGTSVGISVFPEDEVRPERLVALAGEALLRAKKAGSGTFRYQSRAEADG